MRTAIGESRFEGNGNCYPFDMCMIPFAEETLNTIVSEIGIPKEYIFIAATHTHEVPLIGLGLYPEDSKEGQKARAWYGYIQKVMLETVKKALAEMRPAKIGHGTGKSYINVNRDAVREDGKSELGNNFERPSDKTLDLVRIEDLDGKTIALVVNYAVHAVVMNGCLTDGGIGMSGDLPGRTSLELEERFDGAVVLWTSGAAGDQNPRMMTNYGMEMADGKQVLWNLGETGHLVLDFLVKEHVRDILAANKNLECTETQVELLAAEQITVCPGKIKKGEQESEKMPDDWEYEHDAFEAEGTPVEKGAAQPAFIKGFREMFRKRI